LHHLSCGACFYCHRGLDSQCEVYRRTVATAGFVPAGGGFAQYVLALAPAVQRGAIRIPEHISCEDATFIEPLNTCLKGIRRLQVGGACRPGDAVLVFGLGPIGVLLALLAVRQGFRVWGVDPVEWRRNLASSLAGIPTLPGADTEHLGDVLAATSGRGADGAVLATPAPVALSAALQALRPGGRIVLFANTRTGDVAGVDLGSICVGDREIVGSYSSSMDLITEASRLVFEQQLPLGRLVTHRFALAQINAAIDMAEHPEPGALKVMVLP
jgi:L-iditol 2-dehydrogenase